MVTDEFNLPTRSAKSPPLHRTVPLSSTRNTGIEFKVPELTKAKELKLALLRPSALYYCAYARRLLQAVSITHNAR